VGDMAAYSLSGKPLVEQAVARPFRFPEPSPATDPSRMALSTSSLTQWKERQQQSAEQVDVQALLNSVRTSLRAQGLV
jgi:hypothetical protein